jgi:demethylmenaquinone methyltransferase/2-methoxy-6-polyprenyl-1,4-benzoquinol methylase
MRWTTDTVRNRPRGVGRVAAARPPGPRKMQTTLGEPGLGTPSQSGALGVASDVGAAGKRTYVQHMFGRIAGRYDLMNRLMTFGQDQRWREFAVRLARVPPHGRVLDLATGTGDLARAAIELHPSTTVIGIDFALPMLHLGQAKLEARAGQRVHLAGGDALQLPFPDHTFDACLSAFMLRNVVDIRRSFVEQRRVVSAGARVVCLEIAQPTSPIFRRPFDLYFGRLVPAIGGVVSEGEAYSYLPASVRRFVTPQELANLMRDAGLQEVTYYKLALGTVTVHVGIK